MTRLSAVISCPFFAFSQGTKQVYHVRMRGRFAAFLLIFLGLSVIPAFAQKVVTKDGKIIQLKSYRITQEKLLYVDERGKEASLSISDIDLARTQELNRNETSPVILPGMPNSAKNSNAESSLGEQARKSRANQKSSLTKNVFTDDDVAHASEIDGQPASPSLEDFRSKIGRAQKAIDQWKEKTPRELSDGVVGQNQFPGRDNWEQRLYQQKEKMIAAAQACLFAAQKLTSAPAQEERIAAQKAANKLLSDFDNESSTYHLIIAEGIKKAGEWERYHR